MQLSIINFFRSVVEEAKKLHFPSKKETYITSITIVITITMVSLVILLTDFIISKIMSLIFGF